jgi:hypothetical protein
MDVAKMILENRWSLGANVLQRLIYVFTITDGRLCMFISNMRETVLHVRRILI